MSRRRPVLLAIGLISFTLYLLLERFRIWYSVTFGKLDFSTLLLTMASPLEGTSDSFVQSILLMLLPVALVGIGVALVIAFFAKRVSVQFELQLFRRRRTFGFTAVFSVLSVLLCLGSAAGFVQDLRLPDYLLRQAHAGTLYEDHYVDPKTVGITFPEEKKNLVYIFVESLEITYADTAHGGIQPVNYMPRLTALAEENISFSHTETLGGFVSPSGTTLTVGALLAETSGIPYKLAAVANNMDSFRYYMPGLTTLGDILEEAGYRQYFLCGSDASFAGRRKYFSQHGNYEIYDLFTARESGAIPADYHVFWGYEDVKLFDIAKTELTKAAESGGPFNYTMLTVDLHHVGGYICEKCGSSYEQPTANVVDCNDREIESFLAWLREQPFYEDTVVIIAGDHPRMDSNLIGDTDYKDRRMYNCFINTDAVPQLGTVNREFTTMDMFPTTLAALGAVIEGDRLGLGTNIFSATPTLAEELGLDAFLTAVDQPSNFYTPAFMGTGDGKS